MSIHGYCLAKALFERGYEIITWGEQKDGFTQHQKRNLFGLVKILLHSDLIYVRMGYDKRGIFLVPIISKMLGKRVIVELNGPPDELRMRGADLNAVKKADRRLRIRIWMVDHVITVSENMGRYCNEVLGISNVTVIENGGEKVDAESLTISDHIRKKGELIQKTHQKRVLWSGTKEPWQGIETIKKIVENSFIKIGFIIITNDESIINDFKAFKNVFCFEGLTREETKYFITISNFGLAIYGDYHWSRYGFYGSSLKYFEYLINDLIVIASPKGHMEKHTSDQIFLSDNPAEICKFIQNKDINNRCTGTTARSWDDVANETCKVMAKIFNNKSK